LQPASATAATNSKVVEVRIGNPPGEPHASVVSVRCQIVALAITLGLAGVVRADVHGVPMPRGTRADGTRHVSGKGYRDTIASFARWLDRTGIAHEQVGPYRARGVDVTRFLSKEEGTKWMAIHVYRQAGKTWISLVLRSP
jgi:hypothetical protein